ncbi:MAG: hypothetical protein L0H93_23050, partial [Nocardioides sp.]|nr:hypothetical protein [Nocardioides sp.]
GEVDIGPAGPVGGEEPLVVALVVQELPKTRSGKIMRRLLRDVAEKREIGDVTTLADSKVMNLIQEGMSSSSDD